MKIKIFQSISENKVERKVNKFLEQSEIKVISLQYSATAFYFSVMISYEEVGTIV